MSESVMIFLNIVFDCPWKVANKEKNGEKNRCQECSDEQQEKMGMVFTYG